MQSKTELQNQLDGIIEEIGKARANSDNDALVALRSKRQTLEQELDELDAEQSYVARKDAEAAKTSHNAAIEKTLDEYGIAEEKYITAIGKIDITIDRLAALKEVLSTQVQALSGLNPVRIIQPIWNDLNLEQQKQLQGRFQDAYKHPTAATNIDDIFNSLNLRTSLLSSSADRLIVKSNPKGPQRVGGGVRISKLADDQIPFEKRSDKVFENPSRCTVTPLVPGTRQKRVAG